MKTLIGLEEYLKENYNRSVFDEALSSQDTWVLHLHNKRIAAGSVTENRRYDFAFVPSSAKGEASSEPLILPKLEVKLLYRAEARSQIVKLLKNERGIADLGLSPIAEPSRRYHVKNRSLYPLMKERVVVFFTLLEGEVVRGLIGNFSRYEITVNLKGGLPITILRHAVYNLVDKNGTCYLKSVQQKNRDWTRSSLARDA